MHIYNPFRSLKPLNVSRYSEDGALNMAFIVVAIAITLANFKKHAQAKKIIVFKNIYLIIVQQILKG